MKLCGMQEIRKVGTYADGNFASKVNDIYLSPTQ